MTRSGCLLARAAISCSSEAANVKQELGSVSHPHSKLVRPNRTQLLAP
jgi:hypothetical protein